MKRIQLPFEVKSKWLERVLVIFFICWMASYAMYCSFYQAEAIDTVGRHKDLMAGTSMFHNPWQYRMLCPWMIEGIYQVMDHTVYSWMGVHGVNLPMQGDVSGKNEVTQKLVENLRDADFVKYILIMLVFRMAQGILILWLFYNLLAEFVSNNILRWLALLLVSLFMANGVVDSDLTFNTYMDITMYLLTGLVIVKNLSYWWIIPIIALGAANRETSVFIPMIFFFSKVNWSAWPNIFKTFFNDQKAIIVTALATVIFFAISFGLRNYYGYKELETWRVPAGLPMLKLNLLSASAVKTYSEFFGVFAIFPFWALFVVKAADKRLKILFWSLVPVWFALHIYTAIGFQTRLYLVPTLLVIIPVVFEYIERKIVGLRPQPL